MKKYEINMMCNINVDNPSPHLDRRAIAINIVPIEKNDKFENFVLSMEDDQFCCELWEAGNTFEEYGEYFVKYIVVDPQVMHINQKELEELEEQLIGFCYFDVLIFTDKGVFHAWVSNTQNGYYSHSIYYSDDSLKIDVYEKACI